MKTVTWMGKAATSLAVGLLLAQNAIAIDCGDRPALYLRDYDTSFSAAVARIGGWVSGPSVGVKLRTEAKNLLEKIPNADKSVVDLTYMYTICTALRDDPSVSERRKATLLHSYRIEIEKMRSKANVTDKQLVSKKRELVTPKNPNPAPRNSGTDTPPSDRGSVTVTGDNNKVINNSNIGGSSSQ